MFGCHKRSAAPLVDSTLLGQTRHQQGPVNLSIKLLHTDSSLADQHHPFVARDTVHAVIHTEAATDTSTVHATWKYVDNNLVIAENQAGLSSGTNDTHFDLINANLWPSGNYELAVEVDGRLRDTLQFRIQSESTR